MGITPTVLQEYEILRQIRQLQALCSQYVLPRHPQIAAWLQSQKLLSDQERWNYDNIIEFRIEIEINTTRKTTESVILYNRKTVLEIVK